MQHASLLRWLGDTAFKGVILEVVVYKPVVCLFALVTECAGYKRIAELLQSTAKFLDDVGTDTLTLGVVCYFLSIGLSTIADWID